MKVTVVECLEKKTSKSMTTMTKMTAKPDDVNDQYKLMGD